VQANFDARSRGQFEQFVDLVGDSVADVLVKAVQRPFLLQCHANRVEEGAALFLADSLWTRGFDVAVPAAAVRGFPFHLDLAHDIAGRLFRSADFRKFVESRLMRLNVGQGLFDLDPRRTRR